ncbi:transglutaminase-like domain-containing protein [Chitinophaga solisilvae]|uniref:transglutaminase-like domain-containing protein n=1 Tax=Chitinophaga solisilvae TaxID=1233460 RepID=UPI0013692851|nr:transglutaminase-like domain-containing protein [Chitinophaga solisilvae]
MKAGICLLLFFIPVAVFSQSKLPVIKASSNLASVRDGKVFQDKTWTITPAAKPDVFVALSKNVTFYTDQDSISFRMKPGVYHDFYVLLNGKDTAWTRIQAMPPYLDTLKAARKYNYSDKREIPAFTYQSPDDPRLKKIRADLQLDSIAGNGNDASKMINLMQWVHNIIRHDGNSNNPAVKNALAIIDVCRKEDRGVNCRMMATVLNECYLAIGFKSRFVTCMPRPLKFDDCHVINMVYSDDLDRWVWMDPTFSAYVMDEKGELLGPKEVRERLINGQPLIVNPDANWNRKVSYNKENYLNSYMAKNLYRIECTANSEADTETYTSGKQLTYIELLPMNAVKQLPQKEEKVTSKGTTIKNYKTNNPDLFWAKPTR